MLFIGFNLHPSNFETPLFIKLLFWQLEWVHGRYYGALVCTLYGFLGAMITPTIIVFFPRRWPFRNTYVTGLIGGISLSIAAFISWLGYVHPEFMDILSRVMAVVSGVAGSVLLCFFFYQGLQWIRRFWADRLIYRTAVKSLALNRIAIADDFLRFRTGWYRKCYVLWLKDLAIDPLGNWPNGRPNIENDKASTMLAQLDEHWLGIDE